MAPKGPISGIALLMLHLVTEWIAKTVKKMEIKNKLYISNLRKVFHNVGAILLSLMVLFSSLGFTVSTHFCGGEKIMSAVGFVKTNLTCGMKEKPNLCPEKNQISSSCCQNIFEYHHIEDNVKKERAEIFVPDFAQTFYYSELKPLYSIAVKRTYFDGFSPPLIVENITLVHQTFLI